MKKLCFYIFTVGFFLVIMGTDGFACSCPGVNFRGSFETWVKNDKAQAAAVFTGKVLKVIRKAGDEYVKVKMKVLKSFKGKLPKVITINTGWNSGDCGFDFKSGESYLVYAGSGGNDLLVTDICTRTKLRADAKEEIEFLRKIKNPTTNKKDN